MFHGLAIRLAATAARFLAVSAITAPADTIAQVEARTLNVNQTDPAANDEIMAVEGVDVNIWDTDMSISMVGQFDHPKLQGAVDKIAEAAAKHGKAAATLAVDTAWGKDFMERGYRMMSWSYDIALLQSGLTAGIASLKAGD